MQKIIIFSFLILSLANFCCAGEELCRIHYENGYLVGYEGGVGDRIDGYECDPEECYNLPLVQIALELVKKRLKNKGIYIDEREFDRCFKEGFLDGYMDGYYGRPKKKLKYNWEEFGTGGSIFKKEIEICSPLEVVKNV